MKEALEERAIKLAEYITKNKATVRRAAKEFGISKSTVHKDVSERLKGINTLLYKEVKKILDFNIDCVCRIFGANYKCV